MTTDWNNYVAVFATSMTNRSGMRDIMYVMSLADAIKFCTSDETRGQQSSFHWTVLPNFLDKNDRINRKLIRKDDGRFDPLMRDLDINPLYPSDLLGEVFTGLDAHVSEERHAAALQQVYDQGHYKIETLDDVVARNA